MMEEQRSFLGRGWSFPPSFNAKAGSVNMVEEVEDINQSLQILLSTSLGERVMMPRYGCNLSDYQFEPINTALIEFLRDLITRAILFYEPRIVVEKIEITPLEAMEIFEGKLTISIDYLVGMTNSRFNYVYDFYLEEANNPI